MRIIPAIDVLDGKCVRLSKGDYSTSKIYSTDPLELALEFENYGLKYLHIVDLDGAKSKHIVNHKVLEKIATRTSLSIDFGGGLKSNKDVAIAFECGAKQITGGSIAISNPEIFLQWVTTYGVDKIILGADARNRRIAIEGWHIQTDKDVVEFIADYSNKGIQYVVCTDIERDGMLCGAANGLYSEILSTLDVKLIASGGVAGIEDIAQLKATGCEGVIIGKALLEGLVTLEQLSKVC